MNNRGLLYNYFKSIDSYASPVPITYNGRTSFPTFCGGVATLITVIACLYWWVAVLLTANFFPQKNFTLSQKTKLTSQAGTPSPVFFMNQE
jgi:hypothetical protein